MEWLGQGLNRVCNGYILLVMRRLNGCVGDRVRKDKLVH